MTFKMQGWNKKNRYKHFETQEFPIKESQTDYKCPKTKKEPILLNVLL